MVEVAHPVEVGAAQEAHLLQWLSKRLGRKLAAPDLRTLCMSGYTDRMVQKHNFLTACHDFLQKPFTPEALVRKVREILDTPLVAC